MEPVPRQLAHVKVMERRAGAPPAMRHGQGDLALRKNIWYKSGYAQLLETDPLMPLRRLLRQVLHKDLLLDLEDRLRAEAVKAFEMVRDGSGLDKKRARELEGQARFRMMEQGYEEVGALHGGRLLDGGVIPNTKLKVFQPFMRFEIEKRGVIIGLAAMPDRKILPVKNKSRLAGTSLNFNLTPRFDFDGTGPKIGDVFGLLLVCRNREKAGMIDEIAVGVVDSGYSDFLFYEPLDEFLRDQGATSPAPAVAPAEPAKPAQKPAVKLKKQIKPFVPPEAPKQGDEKKKKE